MTADDIDAEAGGGGTPGQWLGLFASVVGLMILFPFAAGYFVATFEHGLDDLGFVDGAKLAGMLLLVTGIGTLAYRLGRKLLGAKAQVPTRERRSRNILIVSCLLGLVIGLSIGAFGLMGDDASAFALLTNSPIDPAIAIGLTIFIGVIMPIFSWQWHRSIDEHERDAYRAGAVAGAYLFMIGAPAWWLLWRGGLAPQPDGVIFYYAFCLLFLVVWLWKKYR